MFRRLVRIVSLLDRFEDGVCMCWGGREIGVEKELLPIHLLPSVVRSSHTSMSWVKYGVVTAL